MVWLCSGLESCYFVFSPAAVAFWCQPWRANIFILFLVLYVTAPDCWDNIFTFCAFLAFCWGRGEIPGGGGVCSRVLRGGGEWEGGEEEWGRWTGKLPWNCPLSLSPSYQLPLLCFTFRLKRKFWSLIFYQKILTQLSCIMTRGGCQLWVKSSMKCTYFMLQALFDGED